MLKKQKNKQRTVAEKVAEIILHPNQSGSDSESEDEATTARIIEYDEDEYELPTAGTTEFRKRNVKLLSEQSTKYKGKIASRKDFEENSEEDDADDVNDDDSDGMVEYENSESSDDEEALKAFSSALKSKHHKNDENVDSDLEEDVEDEDNSVDEDNSGDEENSNDEDQDEDDVEDSDEDEEAGDLDNDVMSKVNHEAEIQKGLCVQNQLRIWEKLLELRINSQKLLAKTNQLPSFQELKNLERENAKYKEVKQETCKQTSNLLQNLLLLQETLSTQFSELNKTIKPSLKRSSPFRGHGSGEPPLKQVTNHLEERFQEFRSYRNSVLLKWDDRTKLLQPGAGSKKKSLNEEYDIIKKIDNALLNKSVLVQKSQQVKSSQQNEKKDAVKGLENDEENLLNCNIYDDTDFYHQQLRELIEYKANTSSNMSEVTKQFMELQKLRQKMKKKVDTRASKGRKLRYVVHNKLINFMAPNDNSTWTIESIDELSKSLFV